MDSKYKNIFDFLDTKTLSKILDIPLHYDLIYAMYFLYFIVFDIQKPNPILNRNTSFPLVSK